MDKPRRAEDLRKRLDKLVTINPPMRMEKKIGTVWVKPTLRASIDYRGMTGDGKLRHPSFKGLVSDSSVH